MRRERSRRGSAMLESALIVTAFLATLIALLDVGVYLFLTQSIEERCRQALRFGTVQPFDATLIENVILYGHPGGDPAEESPSFNLRRSMINVERLDTGTTEDRLKVTISGYRYNLLIPRLVGRTLDVTLWNSTPYEGL